MSLLPSDLPATEWGFHDYDREVVARAWARAQLLTRARRFVRASGVAEGDAGLQVGSRLCLQRVSPMFEGEGYVVTQVEHRFDLAQGYRTHFEAERAWVGQGA